jgi:hypothetical protein
MPTDFVCIGSERRELQKIESQFLIADAASSLYTHENVRAP